jgi:hypothetical protein
MERVTLRFVIASISALLEDLNRANRDLTAVRDATGLPLDLGVIRHKHLDIRFQLIEYSELADLYLSRVEHLLLHWQEDDIDDLFLQSVEIAFILQEEKNFVDNFDDGLGELLGRLWLERW